MCNSCHELDDTEHLIMKCKKFENIRKKFHIEEILNDVDTFMAFVQKIIKENEKFQNFIKFLQGILLKNDAFKIFILKTIPFFTGRISQKRLLCCKLKGKQT